MAKRPRTAAQRHHDFMVEVREREAEWNETRNPAASEAMLRAQRKGSPEQFARAQEEAVGRIEDREQENRDLLRKANAKFFTEREES